MLQFCAGGAMRTDGHPDLEAPRVILGTRTLTDTVDAALDEVIKLQQRRRLVELLFTPGRLQLDDPDVMSGAWR
ncbi:MAG: hypothetical protein ACP5P1_13365 [Acidimicrobiales bacterium]